MTRMADAERFPHEWPTRAATVEIGPAHLARMAGARGPYGAFGDHMRLGVSVLTNYIP